MYPCVYLKKKKEEFIKRRHPWIFSGAIENPQAEWHNRVVKVCNDRKEVLATGYYQHSSIAVKILDFSDQIIDVAFWEEKIRRAYEYRRSFGILNERNNAYRLIFGEGDELPGLIIDNYNGHFVMQAHTEFMYLQKKSIEKALRRIYGDQFLSFYDQSEYALPSENSSVPADTTIKENDLLFYVNWKEGQKTGFFLDQRDNRAILRKKYAKGKVVLNTFAYSGGFSVYAAAGGAHLIHSVDTSSKAIEWCNLNMRLNGFDAMHHAYEEDTFVFLKQAADNFYDVIILDPPAFAKNLQHKHTAVQAYKRLNLLALKKVKHNGIIFTFSCSGIVDKVLFFNTVVAACFESGRKVKILDYLHLPFDHPVLPSFPEGEYLKGLVLFVE